MGDELNLATRPFVNTTVPAVAAVVIALGIVIFTVVNIAVLLAATAGGEGYEEQAGQAAENIEQMEADMASVDLELARVDLDPLRERIEFANALIERRTLNWTRLFDRLEAVTPERMRMLRISPIAREGGGLVLSLRVEVTGGSEVRGFIEALQQSPHFSSPRPRSQSTSPGGGQQWELEVAYRNE